MTLIGFLAQKYHGKDTAADYLIMKYHYIKLAFAKPIKDILKILFGFSDEQLYGKEKEKKDKYWKVSPRQMMEYFGTDICRQDMSNIVPNIGSNFWVHSLKHKYLTLKKQNPNIRIVISDVRFQNEVDLIHDLGGIVVKLYRPSYDNKCSHIAERGVKNIDNFDFLIINNGTKDDLYNKLDKYIENIKSEASLAQPRHGTKDDLYNKLDKYIENTKTFSH
uniref:Deoxynucleoside monophosphate kinase n=1 Tax=Mimivirus LCMiAC01 TaxID=2506608 RepID=A0A481Z025_9VIRU|nr:MAG: uncharacterized protein LCMiAC01_01120 [Mimivirus LCMiAC01]